MQISEENCGGQLNVQDRPWPYQLREIISQSCPSWPAVHCGTFTVSHHVFLSLSIRIRDVLLHGSFPVDHQSRVLLYYTDTPLSRLKYICTVTALALLGASFTLLEEKMPLRARMHVIEVYSPDVLLDISSVGSRSVHDLLPLLSRDTALSPAAAAAVSGLQVDQQSAEGVESSTLSLSVLRLDLDEASAFMPAHLQLPLQRGVTSTSPVLILLMVPPQQKTTCCLMPPIGRM